MEVLTKKEIADEFPNEHLMMLKAKVNDVEPWYADYVNYIVGKVVPPKWTSKRRQRCVAGNEIFEILAHCHSRPTGGHHSASINELGRLRDGDYKNTKIYKERIKRWHDSRLRGDKDFKVRDKVLLFISRFKMHLGKHKSKWYDPNTVKTLYPYRAVEIADKNGFSFKVNGQRLKKYYEENVNKEDDEVIDFEADPT
ncbi:hypothetical protein Tco_0847754 [Tanacetum coccineum]